MAHQNISLSSEQLLALRSFAVSHGRQWKAKLKALWFKGGDAALSDGHLLRQVRNQLGPQGLNGLDLRAIQ